MYFRTKSWLSLLKRQQKYTLVYRILELFKDSEVVINTRKSDYIQYFREFDPGSGRTLAACLTHASRTELSLTPNT